MGGHHLVTNVARTRLVLMFYLMFFFHEGSGKNTYGLVVGLPSKFNMQPNSALMTSDV